MNTFEGLIEFAVENDIYFFQKLYDSNNFSPQINPDVASVIQSYLQNKNFVQSRLVSTAFSDPVLYTKRTWYWNRSDKIPKYITRVKL